MMAFVRLYFEILVDFSYCYINVLGTFTVKLQGILAKPFDVVENETQTTNLFKNAHTTLINKFHFKQIRNTTVFLRYTLGTITYNVKVSCRVTDDDVNS